MSKKLTNSEFISRAIKIHNDRYDYSDTKYVVSNQKVEIRCVKHNILFLQTASQHLTGRDGCHACQKEYRATSQRRTKEPFIDKSKQRFAERFDYSLVEYVTAKVKVKLRCVKHDLVFEITPDDHLSKASKGGCPECRREILGQYHKKSLEDFIKQSSIVHNNFYDYSKVKLDSNMHTKIEVICPRHGSFYQTPTNHLHNAFGCNSCAAEDRGFAGRLSQDEVILRFVEKHGNKYDYSNVVYNTIYDPVLIYCREHDNFFEQVANNHFVSIGCKKCVDKGYSKHKAGYLYINKVSENVAIKVGITNVCPLERAKALNRNSNTHDIINLFYFYHEDGDFIYKLESEILSRFETGIVPKAEMSSGYTETISCDHLPEVIDIVTLRFNQYPNVYLMPE